MIFCVFQAENYLANALSCLSGLGHYGKNKNRGTGDENLFTVMKIPFLCTDGILQLRFDCKGNRSIALRPTSKIIVALFVFFLLQFPYLVVSSHAADPSFINLQNGTMYDVLPVSSGPSGLSGALNIFPATNPCGRRKLYGRRVIQTLVIRCKVSQPSCHR